LDFTKPKPSPLLIHRSRKESHSNDTLACKGICM
jgi:hypothetical protein